MSTKSIIIEQERKTHMHIEKFSIIGKGVYSLAEASRLTKIPSSNIVRWTRGYQFQYHGTRRYSSPIIAMDKEKIDGQPILDFLDLVEIRFLDQFRKHGVSWIAIRIAAQRAKDLLQRTHPFSTKIFKTDGRTVLADFVDETGDKVLLDLVKNQYEFAKVISPYLYGGLEFNEYKEPARWYPLNRKRTVVIDPAKNFGAPTVISSGIVTRVLMQSYMTMKSFESVANWYDMDVKSVRDAVEYERKLVN